jgi:hypothetical protein
VSINIQLVNTAITNFQQFFDRVNLVINALANGVVTANSDANGSVTIGNTFLNGIFAANTIGANVIRGGNVQTNTGSLAIFANSIFLGNSVTNAYANSTVMYHPNVTMLAFTTTTGLISSSVSVGNDSVNSTMNSTYTKILSILSIGNSVTNTVANSTQITVSNIVLGNASNGFTANTSAILLNGKTYTNLDPYVLVSNNGTLIGTRPKINFISTASATAALVDNAGQNRVDITLTAATAPGGSNTQVQYNDSGTLSGTSAMVFNKTTNTFTISNTIVTANLSIGNAAASGFLANTSAIQLNGKTYTNLDPYIAVSNSGTLIGTRPTLNFIAGSNTTLTVADNSGSNRVDITIASSVAAAGLNTQVQFNDSGAFGGSAGLVYSKASNTLTLANTLIVSNVSIGNATNGFLANTSAIKLNNKTYANLDPYVIVANGGVTVGTRPKINFIPGTSCTIDASDNSGSDRVDVQIGINAAALSAGVIGGSNAQVQFNDSGAFNGSVGLTYNKTTSNLTVGNNIIASAANVSSLLLAVSKTDSITNTSVSLSASVVDAFFLTDYRGAEYLITIKDNNANGYQISKVLLLQDGGGATLTEYAAIVSNAVIGTFTASANATHAILTYTPSTSNNTTLKAVRQLVVT